jgi:hypothetical protein
MKTTLLVLALALLANQPALATPTPVLSSTQFTGFFGPKPDWKKHNHRDYKHHHPKLQLDTNAVKLNNATKYGDERK